MSTASMQDACVFVSYSHEQIGLARLLERDLRRLGLPVFGRARIGTERCTGPALRAATLITSPADRMSSRTLFHRLLG